MTKIVLFHNPQDIYDFDTGSVIFYTGAPGDCLYDVVEGEVDLQYQGQIVETLGPGEIFGETALLEERAHSVDAVARTPCRVAIVTKRRFLFMVDQTPNFALRVMQTLAERLRRQLHQKA